MKELQTDLNKYEKKYLPMPGVGPKDVLEWKWIKLPQIRAKK